MFTDVIEWFLGRGSDRRQYKRRAGAFHMWYKPPTGEPRPGIGLELSPNGLMFMMPEKLPSTEFNLILRLNDVQMPVRVRTARTDTVQHHGKPWVRYMCEFVGIAADNWDRLVRYVNNEEETPDRRKMQNQEMAKQDDAYRLLPMVVQERIVAKLVQHNMLELPPPGQSPLLKIFYGGLVSKPGELAVHRVNVHSRIQLKDELMAYDTRFLVTENGDVKLA
jgi:PilZ domain